MMETTREAFRFSDTDRAELESILGSASARAVPMVERYIAELHEPQRDAERAAADGGRAARIRAELAAIQASTESREALARAVGNVGPDTARALMVAETVCQLEMLPAFQRLNAARREDRLFEVVARVLCKTPTAPELLVLGFVQGITNATEPRLLYAVSRALGDLVVIALDRAETPNRRPPDEVRERLAYFVAVALRECGIPPTDWRESKLGRTLAVVFAAVGDSVAVASVRYWTGKAVKRARSES